MIIRRFEQKDIPQLLELMKGLARFEGYIDDFAITEADLNTHGLGDKPLFEALVASENDTLLGMAILYQIPWTYDMRPKLVLKELFVSEQARGRGVGRTLMEHVSQYALKIDASQVIWTVLKGNIPAEQFYTDLGGRPDAVWDSWCLSGDALAKLSKR